MKVFAVVQCGLEKAQCEDSVIIGNKIVCDDNIIGNTRAYVLQGRYLKQLTVDHTVYNKLLKMGRIDEASQCNKNEIPNCLGGKDASLASALSVTPLQTFSLLLLTSDGVHDFVSIDELEGFYDR